MNSVRLLGRCGKFVLGLVALVLIAASFLLGPPKAKLQRFYLSGARIVGTITWYDAYCARNAILDNEPSAKCIRVGKERVNERKVMYAFTVSRMYEFEEDVNGEWKLKHKGPYNE